MCLVNYIRLDCNVFFLVNYYLNIFYKIRLKWRVKDFIMFYENVFNLRIDLIILKEIINLKENKR